MANATVNDLVEGFEKTISLREEDLSVRLFDQLEKKDKEIEKYEIDADANSTIMAVKDAKIQSQKDELEKKEKEIENYKVDTNAKSKIIAMKNAKIAELQNMLDNVEKENLSLNCLFKWNTGTTIRATFTEISKLTTTSIESRSTEVAGMDWAIMIRTEMDRSTKYLSAFLKNTSSVIPKSWSCSAYYNMKLIRQNCENLPFTAELNGVVFNSKRIAVGPHNYIKFEDLLNPSNGFVNDDSIIMEIDLKAYPTKNIELQKMLDKVEKENLSLNCLSKGITETTIRARFTEISKLTTRSKYSMSTKVAGMDWALSVRTEMDGSTKYLCAFLAITSKPIPQSWSCSAYYKIKLIPQNNKNPPFMSEGDGAIFTSTDKGWGYKNYITFEDLLNRSNGFVEGDSIIMEVDLKLYPTQ